VTELGLGRAPETRRGADAPIVPVRTAVIGLGYWGPNLVRVLNELPEAEATLACDLRREQLEAVTLRYPTVRASTSVEDVFADPEIEAVAIATPVSTHYDLALEALRSGKHVFVEKPLASSSAQAAELDAVGRESGLTLMPGHTFLYSPSVLKIAELIHGGELGEIYFITSSRVNLGLHQADVSVAWDLAPHDFSILRYWLGENPVRLSAVSRACIDPEVPDVVFANLEFASGAIANVQLAWLAPGKLRRTAVVGSRKMVVYDDTSTEPVRVFDSGVDLPDPQSFGEYRLTYRSGDIVSPRIDALEPLALELSDFCTAIRYGVEPRSSARLGIDVVRAIEAVERSLESGGGITPVDGDGR
jgi:predicted dehydrogenase